MNTCAVCQGNEGQISQGKDQWLCLRCAMGVAQQESPRPAGTSPDQRRLAFAGDLLDVAVPLWILQLQRLDDATFTATWRQWLDQTELAGVFSEVLPVGGGARGQGAQAFNALARCLAAMAFIPGGVPFAGRRWEAHRISPSHPETQIGTS